MSSKVRTSTREPLCIGALHSIRVQLAFIHIAFTEIGPQYMRGYEEIPESVITDLNGLGAEFNTLVAKLDAYLAQGPGHDLSARLERLESIGPLPSGSSSQDREGHFRAGSGGVSSQADPHSGPP